MTLDPKHKSAALTEGPSRAPARAMLKAVGFLCADSLFDCAPSVLLLSGFFDERRWCSSISSNLTDICR